MNTIAKTAFAAILLLSAAPALAEDAHHPATTEAPAASPAPEMPLPGGTAPGTGSQPAMPDGMMGGEMGGDMMKMMQEMMGRHAGMMRDMMAESMGSRTAMMGQMMAPERVEGRIAFLRTELKVTAAQQPLWDALAEAIRANAGTASGVMSAMADGMPMGAGDSTAPQRIEAQEKALSTRLEALGRLKTALDPFYAALDAAQKEKADNLLVAAPMGMM